VITELATVVAVLSTGTPLLSGLSRVPVAATHRTATISGGSPHVGRCAKCSRRTSRKLVRSKRPAGGGTIEIFYWKWWWRTHGKAVRRELPNIFKGIGSRSWARIPRGVRCLVEPGRHVSPAAESIYLRSEASFSHKS
jgi:hypothetical protein